MIRLTRYAYIGISGLLLSLSLLKTPSTALPVIAGALASAWLFSPRLKSAIHFAILPIFTGGVLLGYLFGGNTYGQILLFLLILTAWEIDSLYMDSKGCVDKEAEIKLVLPLIILQVISMLALTALYAYTESKGLRIGFWPLVIISISLIALLRKLFSS